MSEKEIKEGVKVTSEELIEKIQKTRNCGYRFIHRMELNKNLAFVSINLSCVTSILLTYYVNCGIIKGIDNSLLSHFSFIVTIISFIFSLIISSMNYQAKIDSTKQCNRKLNQIRDQVYSNKTGSLQPYIDSYHESFNSVESHHQEVDYKFEYEKANLVWFRYYAIALLYASLSLLSFVLLVYGTTIFCINMK